MLVYALQYADNDWHVFPVHGIVDGRCTCNGWKTCKHPGKHPRVKGGHNAATTDRAKITEWWTKWPDANIGIATGPSGLVVLDPDDAEGMDELQALAKTYGRLPKTLVSKTGRGFHIYYAGTGIKSYNNGKLHVKADGGYVLAPPSRHWSGATYKWEVEAPVQPQPEWLPTWRAGLGAPGIEQHRLGWEGLGPLPVYLQRDATQDTDGLADRAFVALRTQWSAREDARLRSALKTIPADDYDIWIRTGMALHHLEWERSDGTSIGFEIWDEWSATCPAKYALAALEEKWRSFNASYNGRRVTAASIFHMANERGWTGDAPDSKVHNGEHLSGIPLDDPFAHGEVKKSEPKAQSNGAAPEGALHQAAPSVTSGDAELDAEIERLLSLPPALYERGRKAAAERFSIRTSVFDKLVAAARCGDNKDDLQGTSLKLFEPEAWPEAVNGVQLLDEIRRMLRDFVWMTEAEADAVTLWCVHTYCFDSFPCTPRLAILSPTPECGKSTALEIISRLVPRALSTADVTPAAVFRTIEKSKPVLLIDEADNIFKGDNPELLAILNSGHRYDGSVIRVVGDDHDPRAFSSFSPVALAAIGGLPSTLESRSVMVRLRRKRGDEITKKFRRREGARLLDLARKIQRWVNDNRSALINFEPTLPDELSNRKADNWEPLIAIADLVGGDWPARSRAVAIGRPADRVDDNWGLMLLANIRDFWRTKGDAKEVRSSEIVAYLNALEEAPWSKINKGNPMDQSRLAWMLKPFEIRSRDVWVEARGPKGEVEKRSFKGYDRGAFEDAFARYL